MLLSILEDRIFISESLPSVFIDSGATGDGNDDEAGDVAGSIGGDGAGGLVVNVLVSATDGLPTFFPRFVSSETDDVDEVEG